MYNKITILVILIISLTLAACQPTLIPTENTQQVVDEKEVIATTVVAEITTIAAAVAQTSQQSVSEQTAPATIYQPPPTQTVADAVESNLFACPSIQPGETRQVGPGTIVHGDIVIDGVRQHDYYEFEGTLAYFEKAAEVFAEWGAACWMEARPGDLPALMDQIYATGCDTGCKFMRIVTVSAEEQSVSCYIQGDTSSRELVVEPEGNSYCPRY